ncbi:MAG TPA: HEAT repeat domain-containing protein, partial [Verrucomicrobiae bacterium]
GSTTSSRVTRPGLDPTNAPGVGFEGCMVWRYHPDTHAYEIFAEGSGNTFGLEVDAQGRLYSGHNGGTTRGWHYVQGGFYLKQGVDPGKFGPPRNPYTFGELPMIKTTNTVVRFTHFGAFAEGTAMPSKFSGMLFGVDPLHNVITTSERRPRGATYETVDHEPALHSSDVAFRPVFIANAPDGSLFIADMYEFYIAHGQHYQNQIDPTTGRIYRLRGKDAKLETDLNLAAKTTDELITLLSHPNKWHRHTAVRLLGERMDPKAAPKLRKLLERDSGLGALNALWALYQTGVFASDYRTVLLALRHPYAPVRMWAVRFLGDDFGVNRGLGVGNFSRSNDGTMGGPFASLLAQARTETDPEVLSQMASTARRLSASQAMELVAAVMDHSVVANDPFIPQLCWWVFEAHIPSANKQVLTLLKRQALWDVPVVLEYILPRLARRYAVEGKRQDLLLVANLLKLAPMPKHAGQLMKGFEEAYRGRSLAGLPDELVSAMSASGGASLALRVRQGEAAAITEALGVVTNTKAKLDDRLLYARTFGEVRDARAVPALLKISGGGTNAILRKAAFASLVAYDDDAIAASAIESLPKLPADLRGAAFTLLGSRAKWTQALMAALQSGKLSLSLVPNDVADRLRSHRDKTISQAAAKLFPKAVSDSGYDFKKKLAEVEAALKRGAGSPYAGEAIFMERCATCHKLFFKGGNIGPDLTSYQRDNLGTMLISIVNPNAEIREGYQFINVETKDGRSIGGFQVDRDNQVTVLRGLDGQDVTISAKEIAEVQPMGRSLMPEGLLEGLTEQQLRDFFAYLRISQPITK